jgi:hypothetical protein
MLRPGPRASVNAKPDGNSYTSAATRFFCSRRCVRCGVNPSRLSSSFSLARATASAPTSVLSAARSSIIRQPSCTRAAKFLRKDGLGYVVIRARSQSGNDVSSAVSCREQNHVNACSLPAGS